MAPALLEPFGAALANDRRLREVESLREAAEADKRSLLSRLGRSDLQETIVGAEGGFRPVMERAGLAAPLDVPVLILGETGSGKEVVARAIHVRSRRASGPFLRVNCGAIPSGLIDSELFGHERGSFTGAATLRKGWFERADGGTLFLDEVGELPPAAQVRLLRILQDGTFERVGGQRTLHVDVRIVAATHRDLRKMVAEGSFREDLWYRLAVFPIDLPSLRERPEDVPALASHFALRAATRFGTPPRIPSPEDLELLVGYAWPGNVRELAAVIERAVILGNGERLEVAKALGVAPSAARGDAAPAAASRERGDAGERFPTLDEAMGRHIEAALARTRGRIEGPGGAAALLDINPHTLRARMRKLEARLAPLSRALRSGRDHEAGALVAELPVAARPERTPVASGRRGRHARRPLREAPVALGERGCAGGRIREPARLELVALLREERQQALRVPRHAPRQRLAAPPEARGVGPVRRRGAQRQGLLDAHRLEEARAGAGGSGREVARAGRRELGQPRRRGLRVHHQAPGVHARRAQPTVQLSVGRRVALRAVIAQQPREVGGAARAAAASARVRGCRSRAPAARVRSASPCGSRRARS